MTEDNAGKPGALVVSHDGRQTFLEWQGPARKVPVSTAEMDTLIRTLALHRMAMEPPVPLQLDRAGPFTMVNPNPAWFVEPEAMTGDPLIHLRHPAFGWLTSLIPRSEAKRLAEYLSAIAGAPEPTSRQRPT